MKVFISLVLALFIATPGFTQQTESRIIGKVLDQSKSALPGVTVTVTSKATGAVRPAVTDADGSFAVTNLNAGPYTVVVELAGFQTNQRDVVLGVGQIENIAVELGVSGVTEQVTVTADAPCWTCHRPRSASTSPQRKCRTCRSTAGTSPTS